MNWDINPKGKPLNGKDQMVFGILLFFIGFGISDEFFAIPFLFFLAFGYVLWKKLYIKKGKVLFLVILLAIIISELIYFKFLN